MGAWEFAWEALPDPLLMLFPPEIRASGRLPDAQLAGERWTTLRDQWILQDQDRTHAFAALLDSLGVARTTREAADDDADFLRRVRNSAGLRHAIVAYIVALGSRQGASDDLTEAAVAADRPPLRASVIPGDGFAPQSGVDFSRLNSLVDLEWSQWILRTEGVVEQLRPGGSVVVVSFSGDEANSPGNEGAIGIAFQRVDDDTLGISLGPEELLPAGVTYAPLRSALEALRWTEMADGRPGASFPWPDGIDDALVMAQHTLRWVFLIDRPLDMGQSDEARPPEDMLPAAPLPGDIIRPTGPSDVLGVVDSIIRAMGGLVLSSADATTHGFRLSEWSGWIHAGGAEAVLDLVIVVADSSTTNAFRLEPAHAVDMQGQRFRFGRVVMSSGQALVVGSMPCHAFTGQAIQTLVLGLIEDAAAVAGATTTGLGIERGLGGYL